MTALDVGSYEHLRFERKDHGVMLMTLDRPEKLNAVNARMHTELSRFAYEIEVDPSITVLVITGAGRAFCAGGDFSDGMPADSGAMMIEGRRIVDHGRPRQRTGGTIRCRRRGSQARSCRQARS